MSKTHRRTWQKAEGRAAEMFGAKRQPGSGSGGRADQTRSDSTHPHLFIEGKLRQAHATRTLHDETRELAEREGKTPILTLFDKGRPGFLVVIHSDDMEAVVCEWVAANIDERIEGAMRKAWLRQHQEFDEDNRIPA